MCVCVCVYVCVCVHVCVCCVVDVCVYVHEWVSEWGKGKMYKSLYCFNSVPAAVSESNLRKTFQFGGRRDPPTTAEIQTIVVSDTICSYNHGWATTFSTLKFRHQLLGNLVSHLDSSSLCTSLLQAGRYTKRQVFYLPGDTSKVLRIKNSTVSDGTYEQK